MGFIIKVSIIFLAFIVLISMIGTAITSPKCKRCGKRGAHCQCPKRKSISS